jgi:hypothetical protein
MSSEKNTTDAQNDDDSIMSREELESVSGGCEWGNETMYPKPNDTLFPFPPPIQFPPNPT